ncbi:hypothetical protein WDW37_17100 [Bdellovibrionota bacterium FG-1]
MNKNTTVLIASIFLVLSPCAHALDQIVRPYWSVRSAGMGGIRITTGLYDENFFNNPARVTANPRFRFTLLDPMIETNSTLPSTISKLTGSGDTIQKIANTAGLNNHVRFQTTFPAFYVPTGETGKWAFAFALITSTQADIDLRENFSFVPNGVTDIGPALTVGRKFLPEDRLSVGTTAHVVYRLQTTQAYTFVDMLKGSSLSPQNAIGQGGMLDFDLGATYRLPVAEGSPYRYTVGATFNNLLGGGYSNLGMNMISSLQCTQAGGKCLPNEQPRTMGFGLAATRQSWWKFHDTVIALEFTDIGNNTNGSLWRTVHLGTEFNWKVFALRTGINQGYLTAGLGIDLRFVTLDLNTYGEEMTFNPGGLQDRRFAMKLAFQIQ